jgi:hypothetical protein
MRKSIPASIFGPEHPDYPILSSIEAEILRRSSSSTALGEFFAEMLRDEIDKLIDTSNTDRRDYVDLEKVEKTYIGTRVEIRLRKFWGFPKGRLDLEINHVDVDVKHTMESGWMIPREAVGMPCVLTAADEETARCYMGLVVAKQEYLTSSQNQDKKAQIATPAWRNIRWLLFELPYPPNFWRHLELATVGEIFEGPSGMERVRRLFRLVQDIPIPRKAVADAAQQLDPMKRVRKNGGARDQLWREGIALLSGKYHTSLILKLGLPPCGPEEFISHKLKNEKEKRLVEAQKRTKL